jgi:hypothetical protein
MFGGLGGGIVGVLTLVLVIWALVDIVSSKRDNTWKLIWVVICLLLPLVGSILYYFLGRHAAPPSGTGAR